MPITTDTSIRLWGIKSHGIDNEQCFSEMSTSENSLFKFVETGVGDTEAEAYNDAVESIAWVWGDKLLDLLELPKHWGDDEHDICEECKLNGDVAGCDEVCELRYHVSIYFNSGGNA